MIMGFRPQISESLIQMGDVAALANTYAPPIHAYPFALLRSETIVGIAVATMVSGIE